MWKQAAILALLATEAVARTVYLSVYPGYGGNYAVSGRVFVETAATGSTFLYHFAGLPANSTGGWHVHTGATCAAAGGHLIVNGADPWANLMWTSVADGTATAFFDASSVNFDVGGRTIVVHAPNGTRLACGEIPATIMPLQPPTHLDLTRYPGYTGNTVVTGRVYIADSGNGHMFTYHFKGLPASSTGGWHVHVGSTCETAGGHLFQGTVDPWLNTRWTSDSTGTVNGYLDFSNVALEVRGRTLVVHDVDGTRVACARIPAAVGPVWGTMGKYPGYTGSLSVTGLTYAAPRDGGNVFLYRFAGFMANTKGGWHVHTGTSCSNASTVGGHLLLPDGTDPWANTTWTSDANGLAVGYLDFRNVQQNVGGRAVVAHAPNGTRVACGVLPVMGTALPASRVEMAKYPGYTGTTLVTGEVYVSDLEAGMAAQYRFAGLPANSVGGWHVHQGSSCAAAGGHLLASNGRDPWLHTSWRTDASGVAVGFLDGANTTVDVRGKTIVVHAPNGTRLACGEIAPAPSPVVANFNAYPGYAGTRMARGRLYVAPIGVGNIYMYHFTGLAPNSRGGWHVHQGISCSSASNVGGHLLLPDGTDPWANTMWTSDANGLAVGYLDFSNIPQLVGARTAVIHDPNGTRVACAPIDRTADVPPAVEVTLSTYPGYTGTLAVMGNVFVQAQDEGNVFLYRFTGLPASSTGGWHVHQGTTCAAAGGHLFLGAEDPWLKTMWSSNANGEATGYLDFSAVHLAVRGHALVVHAPNGTRVACGVIPPAAGPTKVTFQKYVGYTGQLAVSGKMFIQQSGHGNLFQYHFEGLRPNAMGGWHVHVGMSCANAGGHFLLGAVDPWLNTRWTSDAYGRATGFLDFSAIPQNVHGRTVVIHDVNGARVACGQIAVVSFPTYPMMVGLARYPGFTGGLVGGDLQIRRLGFGTAYQYRFHGLPANSRGGWHVHSGTSCSPAGGHLTVGLTDPWTNVMWNSDASGIAVGYLDFSSVSSVVRSRTVTVHAPNGTRVACGRILDGGAPLPLPVVNFERYPGYTGSLVVVGKMYVQMQGSGFIFHYNMDGLQPNAMGGWHVHTGAHCTSAGGHFLLTNGTDPWTNTRWTSDAQGRATGYLDFSGVAQDVRGRTVVFHAPNGTRVACGEIARAVQTQTPVDFSNYYGYTGNLNVKGRMYVATQMGKWPTFRYHLEGLRASSTGGWHVHAGTTCADPRGHLTFSGSDPWVNVTWTSDSTGAATSYLDFSNMGINVLGRTIVVHDTNGTRISCGQIPGTAPGTVAVTYTLTFNINCTTFFATPTMRTALINAVTSVQTANNVTFTTAFSCGSLVMSVQSSAVPAAMVTTVRDALNVAATGAGVGTLLSTTTQTSDSTGTVTCNVTAPVAAAAYVPATRTCVPTSCVAPAMLINTAPLFTPMCVTPTPMPTMLTPAPTTDDDDLTKGEIIGAIVGSVAGAIIIAVLLYVAYPRDTTVATSPNEPIENEPVAEPKEDPTEQA